jgi:hypothetical protein
LCHEVCHWPEFDLRHEVCHWPEFDLRHEACHWPEFDCLTIDVQKRSNILWSGGYSVYRHFKNISVILLKVALNTITLVNFVKKTF